MKNKVKIEFKEVDSQQEKTNRLQTSSHEHHPLPNCEGQPLREKDNLADTSNLKVKRKKTPKVVILDDNELSITKYAEEYPENWKSMTGNQHQSQKEQMGNLSDGMKVSFKSKQGIVREEAKDKVVADLSNSTSHTPSDTFLTLEGKEKQGMSSIGKIFAPILNIIKKKKPRQEAQEQVIQSEKTSEIDINQLEADIFAKKKLLKQRKIEEKMKAEIQRLKEEEEKKRIEEREKLIEQSQEEQIPIVQANKEELVKLNGFEEINLKICPVCKYKLIRSKVKRNGFNLIQTIKCGNQFCPYIREINLNL